MIISLDLEADMNNLCGCVITKYYNIRLVWIIAHFFNQDSMFDNFKEIQANGFELFFIAWLCGEPLRLLDIIFHTNAS